ncbi:MAG: NAD(P)/FAD-dependent oxidoreductase [Gammaproteobacteria bacterium]|nr:NAD(P)/FAD-dependent oxidoreductase [Gammaproteobacteria bacterium]
MDRYDSIVIGAGHNGLVCATYLAKGGQKVLVLEAAAAAGGLAADREFHPGFHASVAHSVSHFSEQVSKDLDLAEHGFGKSDKALPLVALSADGQHVVVDGHDVSGAGDKDATAYRAYLERLSHFADALQPFWHKTMPRVGSTSLADLMTFAHVGLNLKRLGRKDMQEFLRVASLPMRDLMDENFDNDLLKAALSWDGMIGSRMAPRSPNSAVLALLYRLSGKSRGTHAVPAGGVGGLADALRRAAESQGVEVRCNAPVDRILIDGSEEGQHTTGVQLASGDRIEAGNIVSAADPQTTFLKLVGVRHLDIGFTNQVRRLRCDGLVGKLHLALNGLPDFKDLAQPDGRMIIAPTMDDIEFAFDHTKYGECPDAPVMEIVVPSLHDASLAPHGQHVLSAHVMYVPRELKGGWTDTARAQMCDRAIDTIARYASGIRGQILHQEFLTPADLEKEYRVTGGHWHHTEFAMDQLLMMRPTYGAAQYSTPLPGLYICSAGSHPGGDLVGAAGHNAAREVLR